MIKEQYEAMKDEEVVMKEENGGRGGHEKGVI